jgi:hypothetical protein
MDVGDAILLPFLAGLILWDLRATLGRPPVKWTRSWMRLLWRALTNRKLN